MTATATTTWAPAFAGVTIRGRGDNKSRGNDMLMKKEETAFNGLLFSCKTRSKLRLHYDFDLVSILHVLVQPRYPPGPLIQHRLTRNRSMILVRIHIQGHGLPESLQRVEEFR